MHPTLKTKMQFKLLPKWKELEDETIIHRLWWCNIRYYD
jgi:hypothetical protein